MNVAFAVAAFLALAAAAIHSYLGERLILSKLDNTVRGQRLLRISWHLLSVAFIGGAVALLLHAFGPLDAPARAVGRAVALPFFGFTLLAFAWAIHAPRVLRHPAWLAFLATAALAWWGGPT